MSAKCNTVDNCSLDDENLAEVSGGGNPLVDVGKEVAKHLAIEAGLEAASAAAGAVASAVADAAKKAYDAVTAYPTKVAAAQGNPRR